MAGELESSCLHHHGTVSRTRAVLCCCLDQFWQVHHKRTIVFERSAQGSASDALQVSQVTDPWPWSGRRLCSSQNSVYHMLICSVQLQWFRLICSGVSCMSCYSVLSVAGKGYRPCEHCNFRALASELREQPRHPLVALSSVQCPHYKSFVYGCDLDIDVITHILSCLV